MGSRSDLTKALFALSTETLSTSDLVELFRENSATSDAFNPPRLNFGALGKRIIAFSELNGQANLPDKFDSLGKAYSVMAAFVIFCGYKPHKKGEKLGGKIARIFAELDQWFTKAVNYGLADTTEVLPTDYVLCDTGKAGQPQTGKRLLYGQLLRVFPSWLASVQAVLSDVGYQCVVSLPRDVPFTAVGGYMLYYTSFSTYVSYFTEYWLFKCMEYSVYSGCVRIEDDAEKVRRIYGVICSQLRAMLLIRQNCVIGGSSLYNEHEGAFTAFGIYLKGDFTTLLKRPENKIYSQFLMLDLNKFHNYRKTEPVYLPKEFGPDTTADVYRAFLMDTLNTHLKTA